MDPYKRIASVYDMILEPLNGGLRALGMKLLVPYDGMTILDVCCGTGAHLDLYRKRGCTVVGLDLSPSMLSVARKRLGQESDILVANATSIPFGDATFDSVVSMLALHEMDGAERIAVLSEIVRVAKKDGKILLIDFHPGPVSFFQGWFSQAIIFVMEVAAGRRHFRNYRTFIRAGGLFPLFHEANVTVEKQKIVGGGTFALYILTKNSGI